MLRTALLLLAAKQAHALFRGRTGGRTPTRSRKRESLTGDPSLLDVSKHIQEVMRWPLWLRRNLLSSPPPVVAMRIVEGHY